MKARFQGTCAVCGGDIWPPEEIRRTPKGWAHLGCTETARQTVVRPQDHQTREAIARMAQEFGASAADPPVLLAYRRVGTDTEHAILADLQADLDGTTEYAKREAEQEEAAFIAEMHEERARFGR